MIIPEQVEPIATLFGLFDALQLPAVTRHDYVDYLFYYKYPNLAKLPDLTPVMIAEQERILKGLGSNPENKERFRRLLLAGFKEKYETN